MGKKNSNEIQVVMDSTPVEVDAEVLESEAYQTPRPDVNVDATVLKTIGTGGPVPIVAPKRETIQLQPIVVPLAVVPYMAQDGGSLRTDEVAKKKVQEQVVNDESNEIAIKDKITKIEKRQRVNKRVFSFFVLLLSGLTIVPFILAMFYQTLWGVSLTDINVLDQITYWVNGTPPVNMAITITSAITFIVACASILLQLVGVVAGTFPHVINTLISILAFLPMLIQVIYKVVIKQFVITSDAFLIAVLVITFILGIVTQIGIHVLNKEEDSIEDLNMEI